MLLKDHWILRVDQTVPLVVEIRTNYPPFCNREVSQTELLISNALQDLRIVDLKLLLLHCHLIQLDLMSSMR